MTIINEILLSVRNFIVINVVISYIICLYIKILYNPVQLRLGGKHFETFTLFEKRWSSGSTISSATCSTTTGSTTGVK